MKPEQLARMCRCGHPRRFHQQGTIWEGYSTRCVKPAHEGEYYQTGCIFFEPADQAVVSFRRDSLGRFRKVAT